MGAIDECVHYFFPYRNSAISDWLVDCGAGVFAATLALALYPKKIATSIGERKKTE
jgi:VanZ family protein